MTRRVSDIAPSRGKLDGFKTDVRNLVGQEFLITGIREWEGEKGPYLAVSIVLDNDQCFFFSSHVAIMRRLRLCIDVVKEDELLATIVKVEADNPTGYYYDIR